jgi:beta-lactamase regulating signal transducer with metallopeptidase domain
MIETPAIAAARLVACVLLASSVQALLIVGLARGAMRVARHRSAGTRYRIGYVALLLVAGATAATLMQTVGVWRLHARAYAFPLAQAASGPPMVLSAPPAWTRPAGELWLRLPQGWEPAVGALWLAGILAVALGLALEWRRWRGVVRRAGRAQPSQEECGRHLAARAGGRSPHELLVSDDVRGLLVVGWFRPLLVIGRATLRAVEADGLELLLLHELAHIHRGDALANVVVLLSEHLLFIHPAVRSLAASVRHERECACDEWVIEIVPTANVRYGQAIYSLALEEMPVVPRRACTATGGRLLDRVGRLVSADPPASWPALPSLGFDVAVAILLLAACAQAGVAASFAADLAMRRDISLRYPQHLAVGSQCERRSHSTFCVLTQIADIPATWRKCGDARRPRTRSSSDP